MKRLLGIFLLLLCWSGHSVAADNSIKMAYNFTTVSQSVVFDNTMRAGGTLQLSASIADGGGRSPGDPITLKLVFYNSSNAVVSTVQQSYTMTLGVAATTYSVTATDCGSSCSTVSYVSVQFYGKDGGYWAGNYGPLITSPSLTFNGGTNILYNPQFGTYSGNQFAQGWYSSAGWQNCALYSGSATCVIDNGASVNGGNYSASGGTSSGTAGGYVAAPTLCCGGSSTAFTATTTQTTNLNLFVNRTGANTQVYVEQIGSNNTIQVNQSGTPNNYAKYVGNGNNNTISVNQTSTSATAVNYTDLAITGNQNTATITQQSTGGTKSAFITVQDNNNSVTLQQKDGGSHYADVFLSGGNKNVDILQQGSASHMARVSLTGSPTDLSLSQSGATQNFYSINFNCATAGGCAKITVTQGQ